MRHQGAQFQVFRQSFTGLGRDDHNRATGVSTAAFALLAILEFVVVFFQFFLDHMQLLEQKPVFFRQFLDAGVLGVSALHCFLYGHDLLL